VVRFFGCQTTQQVHATDRLIEVSIAAGPGYVAFWFLSGMSCHPAADDAPPGVPETAVPACRPEREWAVR
jgi:hypothetical protein